MRSRSHALGRVVVLFPLLGACASLIGLEDAAVDDGASTGTSNGATASAGPGVTTSTDGSSVASGSSSTGDGGDAPASSVSITSGGGDGGASISGGIGGGGGGPGGEGPGTGGGGAGGGGPIVGIIQGIDPVRLATVDDASSVLLLGKRAVGAGQGGCAPLGVGTEIDQAIVARVTETFECEPQLWIDASDAAATSLTRLYDDAAETEPFAVGGTYRGRLQVNDEEELDDDPDATGTFALSRTLAGTEFVERHLSAIDPPDEIDATPLTGWAIPVPDAFAGSLAFGGAFAEAQEVTCAGATSANGSKASFLGKLDDGGDCNDSAEFDFFPDLVLVDGVPGSLGGAVLYFSGPGLLLSTLVPGGFPQTPVMVVQTLSGAMPQDFALRALPSTDYYAVSGDSALGGDCVAPDVDGGTPGAKPFVAVLEQSGIGGLDCVIGYRPPAGRLYRRLVIGAASADQLVFAGEAQPGRWDLVRVAIASGPDENPATLETYEDFCDECRIVDIARAGDHVWVVGQTFGDATIRNESVDQGTFLFRDNFETITSSD